MNEHRKYGLLESDIGSIISILKSNPKIERVVLFGSRAKGNQRNGSDIDIAIYGTHLRLDDILNAKIKFDDLALPYKIELIIFEHIHEYELVKHIERVGIVLFQR